MSDLTFVMPAYNAARTITASILSARRCDPAAVVVVDDGSSDETASVARALGATVISQPNAGPAKARQRGLEAVETPYVLLLDADDEVVEQGLGSSMAMAVERPDAVAVVGQTLTTPKHGQAYPMPIWPEGITTESLVARGHAPAPPASILFRTDAVRQAFAPEPPAVWPKLAEDYELLIRVSLQGPVLYNPDVVATYAWGGGRSSAGIAQEVRDADAIRRNYLAAAGLPDSKVAPHTRRQLAASVAFRRAGEASGSLLERHRLAWTLAGLALAPERLAPRVRSVLRRDSRG